MKPSINTLIMFGSVNLKGYVYKIENEKNGSFSMRSCNDGCSSNGKKCSQ